MSEPAKMLLTLGLMIASLGTTTFVMIKNALFLIFWAAFVGAGGGASRMGLFEREFFAFFFLLAPWILLIAAWIFSIIFLASGSFRKTLAVSLSPTVLVGLVVFWPR